LPIRNITRLLIKAAIKENENKVWDLYVAVYPKMDKETYMTFGEFKRPVIKDEKTEEEILIDVKDIINTFNGEVR